MSEQETSELRERIEASLRERYATQSVIVYADAVEEPMPWDAGVEVDEGRVETCVVSQATEFDGLRALAVAVGLNPDGSDPRTEIATLRQRVDILNARDEVGIEERDRLRREIDAARDEAERAEPRRQRDARDIADADAEIARLRAVLAVTQASLAAASRGERVTVADEVDRLQRENAALRDAAREFLDASMENDHDAAFARKRHAAARATLAALVGGER